MKSVYVSSTFEDLKPYREAVYRGLSKMRYDVRAMEDYVARDGRMVDAVIEQEVVPVVALGKGDT